MKVFKRFLWAELVWATAIFLLILPITILSGDPLDGASLIRWLGRALGLATFPAGITVAGQVFAAPFRWRPLLEAIAAAVLCALLVLELFAFVVPLLDQRMPLNELIFAMREASGGWETRNDAAWQFYSIVFTPVTTMLHAAIGVQVGFWATHALPSPYRRLLYWLIGLGLLVTGFAVYDSTYETIVLHTEAYVDFAAFYTLLIPLGICAGLGLPTLALLRGAEVRGSAA